MRARKAPVGFKRLAPRLGPGTESGLGFGDAVHLFAGVHYLFAALQREREREGEREVEGRRED